MSTGKLAAERTLARLERWKDIIIKQASAHGHDPAIVAAIISRETSAMDRWCLPPPKGILGDNGFGHGPMQIDKRSFPEWCALWAKGTLTLEDGIKKGCEVLWQKQAAIKRLIPDLRDALALRAAIAAYNCGEGNVRKAVRNQRDLDAYTTGKNYSLDVLARAEVFRTKGFAFPDKPSDKEGSP
jgi:hypothetical protein